MKYSNAKVNKITAVIFPLSPTPLKRPSWIFRLVYVGRDGGSLHINMKLFNKVTLKKWWVVSSHG